MYTVKEVMKMYSILVCDDDKEIVEAIEIYLTQEGYQVLKAYDGMQALKMLETETVHLLILDVMMPRLDGIRATLKIRETNSIPIIILSAKSEDADKILGLNIGADDYMTKPFGVLELCARVRTLLRRVQPKSKSIQTPTLSIDKSTHIVQQNNQGIDLTHKEYQLLLYLIENKERVVERDELLNNIWGYDFIGESRALDVHIRSLRKS